MGRTLGGRQRRALTPIVWARLFDCIIISISRDLTWHVLSQVSVQRSFVCHNLSRFGTYLPNSVSERTSRYKIP